MTDLDLFQRTVTDWHNAAFRSVSLPQIYLKLVSEVGELGDAMLGEANGGKGDPVDELGDVLIVLLALAGRSGVRLGDAARAKFAADSTRRLSCGGPSDGA